jgi:Mn-dependent DtxR family transcriptional regulator
MSDAVERRILALVDKPLVCPHGNPIPWPRGARTAVRGG